MASGKGRSEHGKGEGSRANASEHTPLLSSHLPHHHGSTHTTGTEHVPGSDIDPNDFDIMLSKSGTGFGSMGPEVQVPPMLQGPRKYSVGSRRRPSTASHATVRSVTSGIVGGDEEAIAEEDDEDSIVDTPYLKGVGPRQFWLIFGTSLAVTGVYCFDSTIMASSHPVITSYFGASNSASWLSIAFLLTSTAFQPLFGRLSDALGRKPPYMFTLTVFTLATVWCALAQSMNSFIIARAFCGLGAGGSMSLGSIITSDLVPIEIRGAYQSYINIVFGLGGALGAATGGYIADTLGWRWEFGIQCPLMCILMVAAWFTVPKELGLAENGSSSMKTFDYKGSVLLTFTLSFLILGLTLGGNLYPWDHPIIIVSLVLFAIGAPLFIYVERHAVKPIMPLSIITHSPRSNIIFTNFTIAVVNNAVLFNIPIYFQAVLLESATDSGLRLVVPSVLESTCSVSTGFLITYTRRLKWPLVLGACIVVIGTFCLASMQQGLPYWLYVAFLAPCSIGQGFNFPGTFVSVLAVSEQAEQAVATSTLILWRSLGMVLGVALSSLLLQNALKFFLEQRVTGALKEEIILAARERIQAIPKMPLEYREQVVSAYGSSLKVVFTSAAVLAVVAVLIISPIKTPRLGKRK